MGIEARKQWLGIGCGALGMAAALFATSCGDVKHGVLSDGADSLTASLEGHIVPERDSFTVVLSRGDTAYRTVSHAGYFQFEDIDYGLYVLEISGQGYGGYRTLITLDRPTETTGGIYMAAVPWPLTHVFPSDTMVQSGLSVYGIYRFSRNMDRGSVEKALSVSPSVPYRLLWTERDFPELGEEMEIVFNGNDLPAMVVHTVTLDTTARTLQGAPLERQVIRWVVNRPTSANAKPFATLGSTSLRNYCEPLTRIPITFAKPMNRTTVPGRLVLSPSMAYRLEWNTAGDVAYLYPATRWIPDANLEVRLNGGYEALDGSLGGDEAEYFRIGGFAVSNPAAGESIDLTSELKMEFNLPIDFAKLRYHTVGASVATLNPAGVDKVLWTFSGATPGSGFTLILDTAISLYGDTLFPGKTFLLRTLGKAATFRFYDSAQAIAGFRPQGDRIRLMTSWSAYARLKDSLFRLSPAFPFTVRWEAAAFSYGMLELSFPQPIPAGTLFTLSPARSALEGDTLSFRTRPLTALPVRPFAGETLVRADETVVLEWNTKIDTVDFAARVSFDPAPAFLSITQDTLPGNSRTAIRHADFEKGTDYVLKVGGVQDLFGKSMGDTLTLHFRTRP